MRSSSATREVVQALVKLKSYLDYGTFQPIQIAATVTMNEAADYPEGGVLDLREPARRAVRRPRPHRLGHPQAEGHDVRVGADPRAVLGDGLGRVLLACSCASARWRSSPGVGFGPGGEGFVRFALIENEQRIAQGIRNLKKGLPKLG